MVKAIEYTLVKQWACLDKPLKDVDDYQARVAYLVEILVTPDETKRVSWKENLPKVTPWRLHKVMAKQKLLDPLAEEDENVSSLSHSDDEKSSKKLRLQSI